MYSSYPNNWKCFIAFLRQKTNHFCRSSRQWFTGQSSSLCLVRRTQSSTRNGCIGCNYASNLGFFHDINNIEQLLITKVWSNFKQYWFLLWLCQIFILQGLQ